MPPHVASTVPRALTASRSARLLQEQTNAHTAATHAPAFSAASGDPAVSRPPTARLTVAGPPRAAAYHRSPRRRRAAVAAAGGAAVADAAAAAAELLGYPPTIADAIDKEPVRVERETLNAISASSAGRTVDRERATGRRARRAEGELNGGGGCGGGPASTCPLLSSSASSRSSLPPLQTRTLVSLLCLRCLFCLLRSRLRRLCFSFFCFAPSPQPLSCGRCLRSCCCLLLHLGSAAAAFSPTCDERLAFCLSIRSIDPNDAMPRGIFELLVDDMEDC